MLHFILGGSGCGKSEYIRELFCKSCELKEEKLLILVPDQSSLDTEKAFLQKLGSKASRNIKVFGFSRLCDFVIEQSREPTPIPLEEPDRALIMSVVLEEVSDSLKLFDGKNLTNSFIFPMLDAVNEYEKCAVSPDMLRHAALKVTDQSLKNKLTDTALIYAAYDAVLADKYTEPLKRLKIVEKLLEKNNPFEDYIIAIDSFSNFTAAELGILSVIMRGSREMYVALTLEHSGVDTDGLFFTSNRTYRSLRRIASENGIKIASNTVLMENQRAKNPALAALEKNLFRTYHENFIGDCTAVHLYSAATVYDECEYAASEIKRLIVSENYLLNDFAIIMRSTENYDIILQNSLKKYGLRYFDDRREDIADKPLIKLIFYIFDAINTGFEPESVLQILKTGLLPVNITEISEFENYIYCWSVNTKEILKPFVKNPRGFVSNFTEHDNLRLDIIENVRKSIMEPLLKFRDNCKDATARQITSALYNLLLDINADKCLIKLSENYRESGRFQFADEQIRLWDCLMHSFDKMVMIVGKQKMSVKRYSQLLSLQLAKADIGLIPQGQDLITIGSADRIRLPYKKVVFVLGAVEGEFPRTPSESGIYTDNERRQLLNLGLELDYACEDMLKQEKFLAYSSLTSASELLYISFYSQNLRGEKFSPSEIITQVKSIFPGIKADSLPVDFDIRRKLFSEQAAFELCAQRFKSNDSLTSQLKNYFSSKDDFSGKLAAMERAAVKKQTDIKNPDIAHRLFGENLSVSASQVEKYYSCRFSYLCNYGFRIKERRKYSMDSLEYGSFMHYLLQRFFSETFQKSPRISEKKELSAFIERYIDEYIKKIMGNSEVENERFAYQLYRIKETAGELIAHISEELAQSKFRPAFFEYKIGGDSPAKYELTINSGETVSLNGSIDRVDIMEPEAGEKSPRYVRIIDYKTNNKQFNLYDILYGLNLQMLLYLSVICKNTDMLPAGVLYMPAIFPTVNSDSYDPETVKNLRDKELTMNGLLLNSTNVLTGMEELLCGKYIPVTSKNRNKNSSLINEKQFKQIFAYLDIKISEMAAGIYGGKFSPIPAKIKSDACVWCPYGDVCGFAEGQPQNNILAINNEDVFKIIGEAEGNEV